MGRILEAKSTGSGSYPIAAVWMHEAIQVIAIKAVGQALMELPRRLAIGGSGRSMGRLDGGLIETLDHRN